MAFTLLQAGSSLLSVNSDGFFSSPLTLPTSITLATNLRPRFSKFAAGLRSYVVLVNTPQYSFSTTTPLSIDDTGVVRYLTPPAPVVPIAATATGTGVLTGNYAYFETFVIKDAAGNDIAESDFSPAMPTAVSPSRQEVALTLSTSPLAGISARRLYRTTSNGGVFFALTDIADNTTTSYLDNTPDASLDTIAAPARGTAPDLTLIAEFAGRLWGVGRADVDHLRYTESGTMFGWSLLNTLAIPHIGTDAAGVVAIIPRRDALGAARRDTFLQITGTDRTNFRPVIVNGGESVGCVSQESVVVFNDVAYFLARDGVYKWDSTGITSLTNNIVRSWFTSDAVFNRSMFWRAFAQFDYDKLKYRLFLASAGSGVIDHWIEYDLVTGTWWGPHQTDAFQPTCAVTVAGADQQPYAMIGSTDGYLSQGQDPRNDWDFFPVNLSVTVKRQDGGEPDKEKYFGELSIIGKVQPSVPLNGVETNVVTVTPTVGELEGAVPQASFPYDQTQGRERLARLGVGKQMSLQLDHAVIDQDVEIYGYEVNPMNLVGRR